MDTITIMGDEMSGLQNGELLQEIYDKVSNIQGDMKVVRNQIEGRNGLIETQIDHTGQLEAIKRRLYLWAGGLTVLVFILSLIAKLAD